MQVLRFKQDIKEDKTMLSRTMKKDEGFTLIELMIVIAIIGILAAIAIPQFSAYRMRSYNSAAESDLRNAATAQEAYYVDHQTYVAAPQTNLIGQTYGLYTSQNVAMDGAADATHYTMTAFHSSGNKTYTLIGPGGSITTN
jgi:type IV pilus assembly protein PilA